MAGNANASYKAFVSVRVTSVPEATVVHCCGGTTARVAYNAVLMPAIKPLCPSVSLQCLKRQSCTVVGGHVHGQPHE